MQSACAILSSVACPALQYFSTLSHKRQDFRNKKKMLLNIKGAFLSSLQVLCATFLILRRNDMIKTVYRSSRKIVYSCYILMKLEFSRHIFEGTHIQNFRKFCPVEAKFFHADRRTDRHDVADSRFFETLRTRLKKIRNSTHDYFICCRNTLFSSAMC